MGNNWLYYDSDNSARHMLPFISEALALEIISSYLSKIFSINIFCSSSSIFHANYFLLSVTNFFLVLILSAINRVILN